MSRDWKGEGYKGQLPTELALLPTPTVDDAHNVTQRAGEFQSLTRTALTELRLLLTPTADTGGDGQRPDGMRRLLEPEMRRVAESASSGETTSPRSGGGKPSTGLRLSPWFVEWMIGAPPGWSDPDCPLSATEFRSRLAGSSGST